jgi:hypothetical protein
MQNAVLYFLCLPLSFRRFRGALLSDRKRIYEELYPETKAGQFGYKGGKIVEKGNSPFSTFTESTAQLTGESQTTIKREIQIAEAFSKAPIKKACQI